MTENYLAERIWFFFVFIFYLKQCQLGHNIGDGSHVNAVTGRRQLGKLKAAEPTARGRPVALWPLASASVNDSSKMVPAPQALAGLKIDVLRFQPLQRHTMRF